MKFTMTIDRFDTAAQRGYDRDLLVQASLARVQEKIKDGYTDGFLLDDNGVQIGNWKWKNDFGSIEEILEFAASWNLTLVRENVKTMNHGTEFFIDGSPALEWFDHMLSD